MTELNQIEDFFNFLGIDCTEIRIYNTKKGTVSGYFDDWNKLINNVSKWNGKCEGIYFTINSIDKQVMARASNRLKDYSKETTKDKEVQNINTVFIDIDSKKTPAGCSALQENVDALKPARDTITDVLTEAGINHAKGLSGNGWHIFIPINPESDIDSTKNRIKEILKSIESRYKDDEDVSIDVKVFNPARIAKLPTTRACKGDDKTLHRDSYTILPEDKTPCDLIDLEEVVFAEFGKPKSPAQRANSSVNYNKIQKTYQNDMNRLISDSGIETREPIQDDGMTKWQMDCVFNSEHKAPDAFLFENSEGYPGYSCSHNSCKGKGFNDFCETVNLTPDLVNKEIPNIGKEILDTDSKDNVIYHADKEDVYINGATGRERLYLTNMQAEPKSAGEVVDNATEILSRKNNEQNELFIRDIPVMLKGNGDVYLSAVTTKSLSAHINSVCDVSRIKLVKDKEEGLIPKPSPCAQPAYISNDLIEKDRLHEFAPKIDRIVTHPIVCEDGSIIKEEGYCEKYKLYLKPNYDASRIEILDSVDEAFREYRKLFKDFPFQDEGSRIISMTYPLTLMLRHLINGLVPLYHSGASKQGSGKGLLYQTHYTIVTGEKIDLISYPTTKTRGVYRESPALEEAMQRSIGQIANKGKTSWIIDNAPDGITVDSPYLAMLLTDEMPQFKVLYVQDYVSIKNQFVMILTGNNLEISGDLERRAVHSMLEPNVANPHLRKGLDDLDDIVEKDREKYLSCLVTIAHLGLKNEASNKSPQFGSFQAWSDLMNQVIPEMSSVKQFTTPKRSLKSDSFTNFIEQIYRSFGEEEWVPKDVVFIAYADTQDRIPEGEDPQLAENTRFEDVDKDTDLFGYETLSELRTPRKLRTAATDIGYVVRPKINQVVDITDSDGTKLSVKFKKEQYSRPQYRLEVVDSNEKMFESLSSEYPHLSKEEINRLIESAKNDEDVPEDIAAKIESI